jgi:uncharacterized protein
MSSIAVLEQHLGGMGRILLAYSGGVDSALLAVVARRAVGALRFTAAIGRSDSYPAAQYQAALSTARRFDLPLVELRTAELEDPRYLENSPERCYYCKQELWQRLTGYARRHGYDVVIDGTHTEDAGEHRPGLRAAREWDVRSPLLELGWTKQQVRDAARGLNLAVWDAPASPCLSSRIQYGLAVTRERLQQVEAAEAILRGAGIAGDVRVRHRGDHASVEVGVDRLGEVRRRWSELVALLAPAGFSRIELDADGYRRGSLLVTLSSSTSTSAVIA